MIAGLVIFTAVAALAAKPVDISQIMERVGQNQQNAQDARRVYVYQQDQLLRMHRSNGKLVREERAEYTVIPASEGSEKQLNKFAGRYQAQGRYVEYEKPGYKYKGTDIDGALMGDLSNDMMNSKSRDGIGVDLFPLTTSEQLKYDFRLSGTEIYRGRRVYRVAFQPKPHTEDASWKGEALIDATEYQPASVVTSLAWKMPLLVKALLGTDIKGLGFSVSYEKFGDGVWFPVSYGGEFEVRGVFFYKRTISISMQNRDFRKADVGSTVVYGTDAH